MHEVLQLNAQRELALAVLTRGKVDRHFDHMAASTFDDQLKADLVSNRIQIRRLGPGLGANREKPAHRIPNTRERPSHHRGDPGVDPPQHPPPVFGAATRHIPGPDREVGLSGTHRLCHRWNRLRRVRQICVHDHQNGSIRFCQPTEHG